MFTKLLLVVILGIDNTVKGEDEPVMMKLSPGQIIDTFKSVVSSQYLKALANDFAVKAAKHFIDAIRNEGNQLTIDNRTPPKNEKTKAQDLLNEHEAMTLLKDPSPDGDDLLSLDLSDEEPKVSRKKKIPVIEIRKINGVYYRRLLGLI